MKSVQREVNAASLKNDLFGATAAAIISLPMAIGYGVTVFAPLGPEFVPQAALIGLNAAIIGGFFAALLGGTPGQISGPAGFPDDGPGDRRRATGVRRRTAP